MVAVALTWKEHTAADLRRFAAACRDAAAARRMLALVLVLEGSPRAVAAETCGMDRQTLRDWVHRYNAEGLAGLSNRYEGLGRKPLLTPEQTAVVAELVRTGPDLATHGVVRWRRADLAAVIEQRFGVRPDVRTVGKLLRRLGFRRLSVRPRHPGHDAAAQEAHKKTRLAKLAGRLSAPARRGRPWGRAESGCVGFAPDAVARAGAGGRPIAFDWRARVRGRWADAAVLR
jgi:transposase